MSEVQEIPIRPLTMLPAHRSDIEFETLDGLRLVGELAMPLAQAPIASLICLHPLPTHGGYMDSHVLRKAAARLPALAKLAVLRFNFRGVSSPRGTSGGVFDGGRFERFDVEAAIDFASRKLLPRRWLLGWSFGTEMALAYGRDQRIKGAILLSPPLRAVGDEDLAAWDAFGKPLVALVPEHDTFLRPQEAQEAFAKVKNARVIAVPQAKHLWVGERFVQLVLNEIVKTVAPEITTPLPTRWRAAG